MATGDAAGAAGLPVYTDSLLRKDIDTGLNERGDAIAADRTRLKALEAQAINTPKFSVAKSSTGQNLKHDAPAAFTAGAWGTPYKRSGGFTFANGVLTVPRSGFYTVQASMKLNDDDFYTVGVWVTLNDTTDQRSNAIAVFITNPGDGQAYGTTNTSPSVTASRLCVQLNQGDQLRVVGFQRNYQGQSTGLDTGSTSLTFEALFVDQL